MNNPESVEILLIEDNPGDIRLIEEAFKEGKIKNHLSIVMDGEKALEFLFKKESYQNVPTPDLILLDLNLPKKSGTDILKIIKSAPNLKLIPVVVLSNSSDDQDILISYGLHANSFITKPVDIKQFLETIKLIKDFWFTIVRLPYKAK